jgi:hypothetical protein
MMHKRKQIRQAIVGFIQDADIAEIREGTGESTTYRVYANRPTPLWEAELPCVCVYTAMPESGSEPSEVESRPSIYKRDLKVAVEILAKADASVDDTLDDLAEKVEQAIGDNQESFARQAVADSEDTVITDTGIVDLINTDIQLVDDGRKIIGSCKMTFVVPYNAGLGTVSDVGDSARYIHTQIADSEDTDKILAESQLTLLTAQP